MNDFHGFADPHKPYDSNESELRGGLSYLAARAERLRAEKPTLLVAAGDMIQGNNWANIFQGKSSIEAMNAMGFDAMVVGNHEFDFGQSILKQRISEANFPVLGANVQGLNLKPYIIKDIGGVAVAVVGVVTDDTPVLTNPKNVEGLQFLPPAYVKKYIQELKDKGNIVVVVSHIGFNEDVELAKEVEGIDVIVGGHSHTKVREPAIIGKTFIVQAFKHGEALGVLDITVMDGDIVRAEGRLEPITPTGEKNKKIEEIVAKYREQMNAMMSGRVGETLVDLDGRNTRLMETNFGNLITDIMRGASGADAAIINGGSIRTSIKKGPILVGDIYGALPFENYVVVIKLTGLQILDALEQGVSGVEEAKGGFPQVSGIEFTYDRSNPKGTRIKEVFINGIPLATNKEYIVATNDFLAAGGDGYRVFRDAVKSSKDYEVIGEAMKGRSDSGRWLLDVVIDYIRSQRIISPRVEARIKEQKKID
ncbi:MAG: 5'-nucleotidase C-terminal domain-containing protein [Syntrophorhabdaceae bacterium]|jgi:2',3'-cyclic-nucleotide 2'-phosphodiesterase (5'-nucleotidase family)|nr:5'-nucleotidase C-terminal domain-containing protein [Syntrophorhabdaceae bacterium]HPH42190.1 5'-nucleotidase C-terminal domain-containing protein [Syntrophorhabdaceae bacterium]